MKTLIAENSNFIRKTLIDKISSLAGIRAILESTNVSEALNGYSMFRPEVVIVAYKLIGGNSMDILEATKTTGAGRPLVIVITDSSSPQVEQQCLNEGAHHVFDISKNMENILGVLSDYSKSLSQTG